jgi:hypothetical protein
MSDSIVVRLKPGLSRDDADNAGTLCWAWPERTPRAFRDVFVENYESIRSSREALSGPGVTVTVIGPSGFEGTAAISAKPNAINALTLGRHSHAHLFLSGEILMSLRQCAVILYPLVDGDRVRFRVLDLRARSPFEDERGNRVAALEANGPVFLQAGAYSIFVLPRGPDSAPWSGSPERVWDDIPERVYLEEHGFELAEEHFRGRSVGRERSKETLALSLPGPSLEHERLVAEGEPARGRLVVRSAEGEMTLELGRAAATRGVLLGRYGRCDGSRFAVLSGSAISRVHALVIEIAGNLYVVDAGSKNGLWLRGTRVPLAGLRPGMPVTLAGTVATLEWSFLH